MRLVNSVEGLQKYILRDGAYTLSNGTLRMEDLLASAYDLLESAGVQYELRKEILSTYENTDTNSAIYAMLSLEEEVFHSNAHIPERNLETANQLWEQVTDYFNEVAPDGYMFGNQEGDGALIGWWRDTDEFWYKKAQYTVDIDLKGAVNKEDFKDDVIKALDQLFKKYAQVDNIEVQEGEGEE